MEDIIHKSKRISEQMKKVSEKAGDISSDVYKLKPKLYDLLPDWETKFSHANEQVEEILSKIQNAKNNDLKAIEFISSKNADKFKQFNSSLSLDIQQLRNNIAKARHAADGINIALKSNDQQCSRSYLPPSFDPTTSTTIELSIAMADNVQNSSLIVLQGSGTSFMALELISGKIKLSWNLGGDTGSVEHAQKILKGDPKSEDSWYHILAYRVMNTGKLTVQKSRNNNTKVQTSTNSSSPDFTSFSLGSDSRIWIGGLIKNKLPDLLESNGLKVTIDHVSKFRIIKYLKKNTIPCED